MVRLDLDPTFPQQNKLNQKITELSYVNMEPEESLPIESQCEPRIQVLLHTNISSLWMSHVTHVNEWVPCHTYEWKCAAHATQFMSHIWMGQCMSSCHTYECVGASLRCEWVMSHVWIRNHQRKCLRYVPAKIWGMAPISPCGDTQCIAVHCSVLQRIAVCCSVLQCVAVCWSVLQCVAVCCSVLQCVAASCIALQCVAATLKQGAESKSLPCDLRSTRCQELSAKEHLCLGKGAMYLCKRAVSLRKKIPIFTKMFPLSVQGALYLCKRALKRDKRERDTLGHSSRPPYKKAQYLCTRALYLNKRALYLYKRAL